MKLFTVGPVEMSPATRAIGSMAIPYFRTPQFSQRMQQIEADILGAVKAPAGARSVLLTASGSGAMEAAVVGVFRRDEPLLVINGGTFGQRFAEICERHEMNYTVLDLPFEEDLTAAHLAPYRGKGYKGLLIQGHETSIGKRLDLKMVGAWCKEQGCLMVADCVSSFLVDPVDMADMNMDVFLTASQKSLALPPGLTIVVCTREVIENRIMQQTGLSYYLDLKAAYRNAERGQTPYTPALSIVFQLEDRLQQIEAAGGVEACIQTSANLAGYFREQVLQRTPFRMPPYSLSNGLTPLLTGTLDAYQMFLDLMNNKGQVLTPCGGDRAKTMVRVGHMGYLHKEDYDVLLDCLEEYGRNGR
ncbi:MAG TPA: alanine--glyoxylate aminotransferase family protein [Clostridiaceae bacterium]|nr:alanine--glyoxylate aminotransferase family protein [Clostridiaceae bacterium]